jgi:hypothetical protein
MTIKRLDHIVVVVEDLEAAIDHRRAGRGTVLSGAWRPTV